MEDLYINHFAVIVCALLNLVIGALWFSPLLFYKPWLRDNNLTAEDLKSGNPLRLYMLSTVASIIICYCMAFFLGDSSVTWQFATFAGFISGFGLAAMIFSIIAMFERKSWTYIIIDGGYIIIYFTTIGFILGIWR